MVQTMMGTLCSLLMFIIVVAFAYVKTLVWLNKKDTSISYSIEESYYDEKDVFGYD